MVDDLKGNLAPRPYGKVAFPLPASEKGGGKGAPDYEAAGIGEVLRQAKSEANEKLYGKK